MTLKTIRRIERAKWHVQEVLAAESKAAPLDRELKELSQAATIDWLAWYGRRQRLEVAAAERADKGEVLATVFVPHLSDNPQCSELKEVTVTPRLIVTRYLRRAYHMPGLGEPEKRLRTKYTPLEWELRSIHESAQRFDCPPEKAAEFRRKAIANRQSPIAQ